MQGLMQDTPLAMPHLFNRAETLFAKKEIVTATGAGIERTTYGEWADRSRRLGGVLDTLGISADGRVGTFGWNTARHLELWYSVPCTNRVLHTLNIRLFPDQLTYIVNHAEDEVIFVDKSLAGLLFPLLKTFESVKHVVVMDDGKGEIPDDSGGIEVLDYETLLADASPVEFNVTDENSATSMCYTSGTTGNPKGVVYSHRSIYLHTIGAMVADGIGIRESDVVLPVVPMFHANAWGLAHAAPAAGATLVMPGPDLSGPAIAKLIEDEKVTVAAGVPTIWMGVLPELKGRDTSSLRAIPCGGSAVPKALSEAYREQVGLPIMQAWGMTETSPVCTIGRTKSYLESSLSEDEKADLRTSVGYPLVGVDFRVVDPSTGEPAKWDNQQDGELQVAGPWIAASYYNDPRSGESFTDDGWLKTGDVARVSPEGYITLVDRTKDLVKSGGEWISSAELENEIMAHPKVQEAAVIGVNHVKWSERPLACVVVKPGEELTKEEIIEFLDGRVAKWWLPDDVVFIDEVPKTSVGKFSKKTLRDRFADYVLPLRDRILAAAYACLARYGLAKTTVEDVARESGLSRASIYRTFPGGRDELIREVISWEIGRFFAELAHSVADAKGFEEVVEAALLHAHRAVGEHEVLQKLLLTEPERLVPAITMETSRFVPLIAAFAEPYLAAETLRPGLDRREAADYVARMVVSHIAAPGRWDLDDPEQVKALVRTEILAGIVAG